MRPHNGWACNRYSRHQSSQHGKEAIYESRHSILETSSFSEPYRIGVKISQKKEYMQEDVYTSYLIKDSPLFTWVLNTHIPRDYIAMKMTLDNYE